MPSTIQEYKQKFTHAKENSCFPQNNYTTSEF